MITNTPIDTTSIPSIGILDSANSAPVNNSTDSSKALNDNALDASCIFTTKSSREFSSIYLEEGIIPDPEEELVSELRNISGFWFHWAQVSIRLHWTVGVVGIIAATLAANNHFEPNWAAGFATVATLCLAITGLVNPQKKSS